MKEKNFKPTGTAVFRLNDSVNIKLETLVITSWLFGPKWYWRLLYFKNGELMEKTDIFKGQEGTDIFKTAVRGMEDILFQVYHKIIKDDKSTRLAQYIYKLEGLPRVK